jgi:hypothetical protein
MWRKFELTSRSSKQVESEERLKPIGVKETSTQLRFPREALGEFNIPAINTDERRIGVAPCGVNLLGNISLYCGNEAAAMPRQRIIA